MSQTPSRNEGPTQRSAGVRAECRTSQPYLTSMGMHMNHEPKKCSPRRLGNWNKQLFLSFSRLRLRSWSSAKVGDVPSVPRFRLCRIAPQTTHGRTFKLQLSPREEEAGQVSVSRSFGLEGRQLDPREKTVGDVTINHSQPPNVVVSLQNTLS